MMQWSPTRREFLGVAGAGSLAPAGVGNVSWGNVTDVVPDHPFVPEADVRWSTEFGGDPTYLTDPIDDTFYARTRGTVHAITTDGTERWQFDVGSRHPGVQVGPDPAYLAETRTVYVDDDHRVYALDPDDGEVRWRYEDARRPSVRHAIPGGVVALDNGGLDDDALVGLSAADGSERWQLAIEGSLWLGPSYDGENLYFGTNDGFFYALDAEGGDVHWRVRVGDRDDASNDRPRLVAGAWTEKLAFAWNSDEATLYALEIADGTERWRFETDGDAATFPGVVRDDAVYLRDGSSLRVLSTTSGDERWRFDAESMLSWPQVVGETAYVGHEGGVHALSPETGRERWRSATVVLPCGVADGALVALSVDQSIYGLSVDDGRLRWRYDLGELFQWFPHVHEDVVYFQTRSGTVSAVSAPASTPVYDAYRTATSTAGLAVGSLLGGALALGAYRRRSRDDAAADSAEPETFEGFELVDLVAESDTVEVHEARSPDGERVALKRLADGALSDERFAEAIRTWAGLDHEGVLEVREWGTDPVPWVVTEYADATLADRAADLPTEELAHAVADAAETVHRAHRDGVVHGRLTPENVLFVDGDVRVGDWRLAVALRESTGEEVTPADDTARLAEMVRGLLADGQETAELSDVLSRALALDPADRYDSALAFADALRWAVRE